MTRRRKEVGFSLIELLVAVTVLSLVVAGMGQFFVSLKKNTKQQDNQLELNENLRIAMTRITDDARNAHYMVPDSNLLGWIPWVTLFNSNPLITPGANAAVSDKLTIAIAQAQPSALLTADVALDATLLNVDQTTMFDTSNNRLINIANRNHARVLAKTTNSLTISIDADTLISRGTIRAYLLGAPIYLIEVIEYSVDQTNNQLQVYNYNTGVTKIIADGITNLKVAQVGGNSKHLRVTLSGVSKDADPDTGAVLTRNSVAEIVTMN